MGYAEKIAAWPLGYGGGAGNFNPANPNAHWGNIDRALSNPHITYVVGRNYWKNMDLGLITGATRTNPVVISYSGTDPTNGDTVSLGNITGMTELNGNDYTVANVDTGANTFELSGVNGTAYTAYSSGGNVYRFDYLEGALSRCQTAGKKFIFYEYLIGKPTQSTPGYIRTDSQYGGPTSGYYGSIEKKDKVTPAGWIVRKWNTNIQERLKELYLAMVTYADANYSGVFAGFICDETGVDLNWVQDNNVWYELDTDPTVTITGGAEFRTVYLTGLKAIASYVHDTVFSSNRNVIQHMNSAPFGQGDEIMNDLCPWCASNDIGIGGPDVRPYWDDQSSGEYWRWTAYARGEITNQTALRGVIPVQVSTQVPVKRPSDNVRYTQEELLRFSRTGPDVVDQVGGTLQVHYMVFKSNEVAVWPEAEQAMINNEISDPVSNWASWSEAGGTYNTGTVSVSPANISAGDTITITVVDADLSTSTTVEVDNDITGENETVTLTETGTGTGTFTGTLATQFGTTAGTNDDGTMDCDGSHTFTITYADANDANGNPANATTTVTVAGQPTFSQCAVNEHQNITVIAASSENVNVKSNVNDLSLNTRWSPASGDSPTVNQWIIADMGGSKLMSSVNTALYKYDEGTTNYKIDYSNQGSVTITGVTQANPVVITATNSFSDADTVTIWGTGVPELDGNQYTVANRTGSDFELSGVDGTANTEYVSGGECQVFSWVAGIASQNSTVSNIWENDALAQTARYVRLYCNSRSDSNWIGVNEFEICATATTDTGTTSTIYTEVDPPLTLETSSDATWEDKDLSSYTGITFAIVRRQNTSVNQRQIGVRENGDTTAASEYDMRTVSQDVVIVPVDGSGIIEVYEEVSADSTIDLIGYLTGGTKTTRTDKTPSYTSGAWYDLDISSDTSTDTAVAAIYHIVRKTGRKIGLRPKGSSEGDLEGAFLGSIITVVGCDGSEVSELYQANAAVDRCDLLGYFTSADDLTVLTTFEDITPTGTGAYEEKTISTDTAGIVVYASGVTESQDFAVRNADITLDYYYSLQRSTSAWAAACSSANKVDVKAENADTNLRVPIKFNRSASTTNPTAVDDIASAATGAANLTIDVLANDYDPEFGARTITSLTQPSTGTAAIVSEEILYTPAATTAHEETFTYKITSDGSRESDAAATVTVVWNAATTANNFTTSAGTADDTVIDVVTASSASDTAGHEITIKSVGTPSNGSISITDNREVTYTSDADFTGEDTVSITLTDGYVNGDITVTMTISVGGWSVQSDVYTTWTEQ